MASLADECEEFIHFSPLMTLKLTANMHKIGTTRVSKVNLPSVWERLQETPPQSVGGQVLPSGGRYLAHLERHDWPAQRPVLPVHQSAGQLGSGPEPGTDQ